MAPVVSDQTVAQRPVGGRLQPGIERGPHRQTAAIELRRPEPRGELAAHLLDEMFRLGDRHLVGRRERHRSRPGERRLGFADTPVAQHPADHVIPPRARRPGAAFGVVVVRRLGQSGEKGGLGDGQLVERLVEVVYGGRRDAVGAEPEIDLVEVEFENALLRKRALDAEGEKDLAHLAPVGNGVGEQEILRHLLGDGRCADRPPVGADSHEVPDHGDRDPGWIDPGMLEERLVLGRDEGVDHPARHGGDRDEDPLFRRELGEQSAVSGMDSAHHGRFVVGELGVVRQTAAIGVEQPYDTAAGEKPDDDENRSQ